MRRIEHRMDERLDTNERRVEQVLGLQRRLLEDLRSEIGEFWRNGVEQSRQFGEQSPDTSSTAGSANSPVQGGWSENCVGTWLGPFRISGVTED